MDPATAKMLESPMHYYGVAMLGLCIMVIMMFIFVWAGKTVIVPVANALAAWSGENAKAAQANQAHGALMQEMVSDMRTLYTMMRDDRERELRELASRGERLARSDEGRTGSHGKAG